MNILSRIKTFFRKPVDPMEARMPDGYTVPAPGTAQTWAAPKTTPDIMKLSKYETQLLFLYCDFMPSLNKYTLLSAERMCTAFTQGSYSLWKKKDNGASFPVALDVSYNGAPKLPIQGEILKVNVPALVYLDMLKENGVQFVRKRVKLIVPYREKLWVKERDVISQIYGLNLQRGKLEVPQTAIIKAHMYVGVPSHWDGKLDAGYSFAPVRRFKPKNVDLNFDDYYAFTTKEFAD